MPVRAQEHQHQAVARDVAIRAAEPRQAEVAVRDAAEHAAAHHQAEAAVLVALHLVPQVAGYHVETDAVVLVVFPVVMRALQDVWALVEILAEVLAVSAVVTVALAPALALAVMVVVVVAAVLAVAHVAVAEAVVTLARLPAERVRIFSSWKHQKFGRKAELKTSLLSLPKIASLPANIAI